MNRSQSVRLKKEEVIERLSMGVYAKDPAQFTPDSTGYVLDEWQKRAICKLFKPGGKAKLAIAASHGVGKTFMTAIILHHFLWNFIRSKVAITGPTGKQTKAQVWTYVSEVHSRSVFKEDMIWQKTKVGVKASPEMWMATWLTSKEPKSIEGFHGPEEGENLLWAVEESKGVADAVFEAILGALSHKNNYLYISSTCGKASGFFYNCFHSKKDEWETEQIPYTESSRISTEKVEKWAKTWGRNSSIFRARVLAQFPEEDDKIIVPLSWCERALELEEDDGDDDMDEAA